MTRRNGGGTARANLRKATVQFACERCRGLGRKPALSQRTLCRKCEAAA